MQLTTEVTELPQSKAKIAVTVPSDELERHVDRAARSFGREMNLPGFRKGKVPPRLVLQRLGRSAVVEEALREGLPQWYERAMLASGVAPVGDPKLDMPEAPEEGAPVEFTIEVGVRPSAELGEYKGLEVGREELTVPAADVDAEIERMRESIAGLETVERAAGDGDFLLIDYAGEIDGESFAGGTASDYLLELGSDQLIEGFNEALMGAEAGEERRVEVTFPDDYQAEDLAGKDAVFKVSVKEVREKQLPELNDDFAADNSDFDTLAELRADIESRLLHSYEHQAEHKFRDDALDAAVAAATIELPEEIVTARATEVWERVERQLQSSGMDPEVYLKMQGKDRDEAIADARDDAESGLRREAVLAAVVEAEGIEATEEELLEALEPPAGEKGKPKKLLARLREEGRDVLLAEEIRMRKAADLIVAEAQAGDAPADAGRDGEEEPAKGEEKRIWTPEDEAADDADEGPGGKLWTPGDD